MNDGRHPATQGQNFPKATSWLAGGDVPGKDGRSLINDSQEPGGNSVFKIKHRKKSPDPSSNEESSVAFEETFKSSHEISVATSGTATGLHSEAALQSCETESVVPEVQRPSILSSGESIAFPLSPESESGFMSVEGNVQFKFSNCSFCFRRDLMLMISVLNSQFRRSKRISF